MSGIFQVASLPSRGMSPLRPTRPPPSAAVFGAIAKGDDHEAPFVAELLRFLESRGLFVPKGLIEAFEATASPRTAEELAEGVGRLEKGVPLIFAGRLRAASWQRQKRRRRNRLRPRPSAHWRANASHRTRHFRRLAQ